MHVVTLAVGKRGYAFAAYNLAFSIKHFDPTARITLIADESIKYLRDLTPFDEVKMITSADTLHRGSFSPSMAKLSVQRYITGPYLFLDADNVALRSLADFWEKCNGSTFLIGVEGKGGRNDAIPYSVWASNETIWDRFGLAEDATYYASHSDWWYSDGSQAVKKIFQNARKLMDAVTMADLRIKWGKAIPDELPLGAAISKAGLDPTPSFAPPAFLGNRNRPISEIRAEYPLLSMYGNGKGKTLTARNYFDFYDRHMRDLFKAKGMPHQYKINFIMSDKWINK